MRALDTDKPADPALWEQFHKVWGQAKERDYQKGDWMRLQQMLQECAGTDRSPLRDDRSSIK